MSRIADRERIESMIPYDSSIIFLDEIFQNRKGGFVGTFKVTEEGCGGCSHKPDGESLLFRGVDFGEMAAQLLGVAWALQHPKFSEGKKIILVGIGRLSFKKPVYVGDDLKVTIIQEDLRQKMVGEPDELSALIIGKNIVVSRKREEVATIGSVKLICGDKKALSLTE